MDASQRKIQAQMKEFTSAFWTADSFFEQARRKASQGLKHTMLRSLYWKMFLGCLSRTNLQDWAKETEEWRGRYGEKKLAFTVNPAQTDEQDLTVNNPLSKAKESAWSQFWQDNQLADTVKLDLKRTHADKEWFQSDHVQSQMLNILVIWAKEHSSLSYRQGMNELLAVVLHVVATDAVRNGSNQTPEADKLAYTLLDAEYVEHDAFALFSQMMVVMGHYFTNKKDNRDSKKKDVGSLFSDSAPEEDSAILVKCNHIHTNLLAKTDALLMSHLQAMEVQPRLFLLRWTRLIFAQDMPMDDIVVLWDSIFAQIQLPLSGVGFPFADWISVAMCEHIRNDLLRGDNIACFRLLLTYPKTDVRQIIDLALQLQEKDGDAMPKSASKGNITSGGLGGSVVGVGGAILGAGAGAVRGFSAWLGKPASSSSTTSTSSSSSSSTSATVGGGGSGGGGGGGGGGGMMDGSSPVKNEGVVIVDAEKRLKDLKLVMVGLGFRLDKVITALNYGRAQGEGGSPDEFILQIAELKQIKDMLLGRLSTEPFMEKLFRSGVSRDEEEFLANLQAAEFKLLDPDRGAQPTANSSPSSAAASSSSSSSSSASASASASATVAATSLLKSPPTSPRSIPTSPSASSSSFLFPSSAALASSSSSSKAYNNAEITRAIAPMEEIITAPSFLLPTQDDDLFSPSLTPASTNKIPSSSSSSAVKPAPVSTQQGARTSQPTFFSPLSSGKSQPKSVDNPLSKPL